MKIGANTYASKGTAKPAECSAMFDLYTDNCILTADKILTSNSYTKLGDTVNGTVTLPNTDGSTPDAALVLNTAHFGAGNATAGTFSEGAHEAQNILAFAFTPEKHYGSC